MEIFLNELWKHWQGLLLDIEIYSIDEAFLGLNGFENYELSTYCNYIRRTIKQWVGIPVSIGKFNKNTFKIANNLAKKNKEYDGVCILKSWFEINEVLKLNSYRRCLGHWKASVCFFYKNIISKLHMTLFNLIKDG